MYNTWFPISDIIEKLEESKASDVNGNAQQQNKKVKKMNKGKKVYLYIIFIVTSQRKSQPMKERYRDQIGPRVPSLRLLRIESSDLRLDNLSPVAT